MNNKSDRAIQAETPRAETMYVAWCDVMGSASMMIHGFEYARYRIYAFHMAALTVSNKLKKRVTVVPMSDGIYIVSVSFEGIKAFLSDLYNELLNINKRRYAIAKPGARFLARCGVAYGGISLGLDHTKHFRIKPDGFADHFRTVLVGPAVSVAYRGESSAPPMGVYLDRSVLQSPEFLDKHKEIARPYFRWFDQTEGPNIFKETIAPYFEALRQSSNEYEVPVPKIDAYLSLAREYFQVPSIEGQAT